MKIDRLPFTGFTCPCTMAVAHRANTTLGDIQCTGSRRLPMTRLFAVLLLLGLTGCATIRPPEARNPAPSSLLTAHEARAMAERACGGNPRQIIANVAPTGSMVPYLDNRTAVVLEACAGAPLHKGDLVVFHRDAGPPTLHRVCAVRGSFILTAGDNNPFSDGWIPETLVSHRVVALVYSRQ